MKKFGTNKMEFPEGIQLLKLIDQHKQAGDLSNTQICHLLMVPGLIYNFLGNCNIILG